MKKVLYLIVTLVLILSAVTSFAETYSSYFSSMTDEELRQLIQDAQKLIQDAQIELNNRQASADAASLQSDGMVTVKEAGFSLLDNGKRLYYSFIAHSNLTDKMIEYPEFRFVVRDNAGNLIVSDSQTLNVLYPGQDIAWGTYGWNVEGENPATIEVEFIEPDKDWRYKDPNSADYPNLIPLEVESARLKNNGNIIGEFSNPNPYDIGQVAISVLFRDENNRLLGGDTSFVNGVKAGKTTPFEIRVNESMVTDNYEVYVQPW